MTGGAYLVIKVNIDQSVIIRQILKAFVVLIKKGGLRLFHTAHL